MIKRNEKIIVRHRSHINPKTNLVEIKTCRAATQSVNKVYKDGWVETSAGDIWPTLRVNGVLHTTSRHARTEEHSKYWDEKSC